MSKLPKALAPADVLAIYDAAEKQIDRQHAEIEALKAECDALLEALYSLVEPHDEKCWFDHDGYCQAHYMDHVMDGCRVANARAAIAKAGGNDE